jgi:uncharacterized membrane protein (UPF0127 family)
MLSVRTEAGALLCERCEIAASPLARLRGLLGRAELAPGGGLLIRPSSSIHTLFMRFTIDVVFLAPGGRVLHVAAGLRPWRVASRRGACAVLELAAGECALAGVASGDTLVLEERAL